MQIFAPWHVRVFWCRNISPKVYSAKSYLKRLSEGHAFQLYLLFSSVAFFFVIDLLSPSASCSCGVAGGVEILVGEASLSVLCMKRKLGSD